MSAADTARENEQDSALLDAVMVNDGEKVEKLLADGANPNYFEDRCMIRPLHFAAVYNAMDVIFPLVKAGANIHATTNDGLQPIHIATQLKHEAVKDILTSLSTNLISLY